MSATLQLGKETRVGLPLGELVEHDSIGLGLYGVLSPPQGLGKSHYDHAVTWTPQQDMSHGMMVLGRESLRKAIILKSQEMEQGAALLRAYPVPPLKVAYAKMLAQATCSTACPGRTTQFCQPI